MKAAFFNPEAGFTLTDIETPEAAVDEAVIAVEACGVCGSDRQVVRGEEPPAGTEFPVILGHEIAGIIETMKTDRSSARTLKDAGDDSRAEGAARPDDTENGSFQPGQRVIVYPFVPCGQCRVCQSGLSHLCSNQQVIGYHRPGGFAEKTLVPVDSLIPLSPGISAAAGALLVDAFATPYHALKQAGLRSGEKILVLGTGGIGLAAMLLARAMGAEQVGLLSRREQALVAVPETYADKRWALGQGIRQIGREVRRWSKGGVDVVIDTTGSAELTELALELLHPGGRLAMVGMQPEELQLPVAKTVRRGLSILASYGSTKEDVKELIQYVETGKLHPEELIAEIRPLQQIAKAFGAAEKPGRVIVSP